MRGNEGSARRRIVDGWVWMATFRAGIARELGIQRAVFIADQARAAVWGKPSQLAPAAQDRS